MVPSKSNRHKQKQRIPSECEGEPLYCEGDGALERVAQGGCGVSPLEILRTFLDMILCNVPTSDTQTDSDFFHRIYLSEFRNDV